MSEGFASQYTEGQLKQLSILVTQAKKDHEDPEYVECQIASVYLDEINKAGVLQEYFKLFGYSLSDAEACGMWDFHCMDVSMNFNEPPQDLEGCHFTFLDLCKLMEKKQDYLGDRISMRDE